MLYIFLSTIAVLVLIFSSITDIKKREVPDWISYFFIISAVSLRVIYAIISKNQMIFWYGIFGFGIAFLLGYLMYFTKQWGGGDAKLLMGLGAAFATFPEYGPFIFLLILIINILFFGAIYGMIYAAFLAVKNWKPFKKDFLEMAFSKKSRKMRIFYMVSSLFLLSLLLFVEIFIYRLFFVVFAFFLFIYPYFLIAVRSIEKTCMLKQVKPSKLTEGDWIAKDIFVKGKYVYGPSDLGITTKNIKYLIRNNIRNVVVKEGMPFVPPFLIGLLFTLIFGDISYLLL